MNINIQNFFLFNSTFTNKTFLEMATSIIEANSTLTGVLYNPVLMDYNSTESSTEVKYKYENVSGSLEKQTYISKVGIYDENRNLIASAKVSKPVKKTEKPEQTIQLINLLLHNAKKK
jgi:hypothetical protein